MISCKKAEDLMFPSLKEELNEQEAVTLREHICSCVSCANRLQQYKDIHEKLSDIPEPELPEGFHTVLTDRLSKEKILNVNKLSFSGLRRYAVAAAGIAFTLIMLSIAATGIGLVTQGNEMQAEKSYSMAAGIDLAGISMYEEMAKDTVVSTSIQNVMSEDTAPVVKKTFNITLKVDSFDEAVKTIRNMDGYNVNSDVVNRGTYQYGHIVRRIEESMYEQTVNNLRSLGEIIYEAESEEMLTDRRMDMLAVLKAKEEERDRLFALLEKSRTMDVMVMVEGRLGVVENEIDNYKGILSEIDTNSKMPEIYINLEANEANVSDTDIEPFSNRVKNNFIGSINNMIQFFENIAVFISAAIIPCLLITVIILPVLLIIRRVKKGRVEDEKE